MNSSPEELRRALVFQAGWQLEASREEVPERQAGPTEEFCLSSLDPQQVRGRSGTGEKSPEPCFSHKDDIHWPVHLENEAGRKK